MQQNRAGPLLLNQPGAFSKCLPLLTLFFNSPSFAHCQLPTRLKQANDRFWNKKEPQQPALAPVEQQDEPAGADELAAEGEAEVELDSLGRLFIQLADAPSLQDEAEISHTNELEVTLISSDSDSPIPIRKKTRAVIRKV